MTQLVLNGSMPLDGRSSVIFSGQSEVLLENADRTINSMKPRKSKKSVRFLPACEGIPEAQPKKSVSFLSACEGVPEAQPMFAMDGDSDDEPTDRGRCSSIAQRYDALDVQRSLRLSIGSDTEVYSLDGQDARKRSTSSATDNSGVDSRSSIFMHYDALDFQSCPSRRSTEELDLLNNVHDDTHLDPGFGNGELSVLGSRDSGMFSQKTTVETFDGASEGSVSLSLCGSRSMPLATPLRTEPESCKDAIIEHIRDNGFPHAPTPKYVEGIRQDVQGDMEAPQGGTPFSENAKEVATDTGHENELPGSEGFIGFEKPGRTDERSETDAHKAWVGAWSRELGSRSSSCSSTDSKEDQWGCRMIRPDTKPEEGLAVVAAPAAPVIPSFWQYASEWMFRDLCCATSARDPHQHQASPTPRQHVVRLDKSASSARS